MPPSTDSGAAAPPVYLLDNRAAEAGPRFGALADLFDAVTARHLHAAGIGAGWRCWEVGAGGASVATWMAGEVGPTGSVLATDIDVSWTGDGTVPFTVRRHDVAADPPPEGGFDLVHARLVLLHVPRRLEALRRMVAALRPGGVLLIEDFDPAWGRLACPDAVTPAHHRANRIREGFHDLLARREVDLYWGRKLPRLLREAGLHDVGADAHIAVADPAARSLEAANVGQVRDALVATGSVTGADIDGHLALLAEGGLDVTFPPLVSAWGRR